MDAGLEQALDFLETVRFSSAGIEWLARSGRVLPNLLAHLAAFRIPGDFDAMLEETIFFADEPICASHLCQRCDMSFAARRSCATPVAPS